MSGVSQQELDVARRALDAFGMRADAQIAFVKHRENHVYRVSADGIDYSLRMHRHGYHSDAELRDEILSLHRLASAGLPVPAPVATTDGEFLALVRDDENRTRQATLQRWVDNGRQLGDSGAVFEGSETPDRSRLTRLGQLIGRLHDFAEQSGTPSDYARPAWDLAGLTGATALWGDASSLPGLRQQDAAILSAAHDRLRRDLLSLPIGADRYGVIHADMTFENVLDTGDELIALDFDDSGEGWFLFDLATTAFWCTPHPEGSELIDALLDGYTSVRTTSPDDLQCWNPLLMARALSYLGWAAQRPDDPTSAYHLETLAPWIVAAAERFVATGDTGWPVPRHLLAPTEGESAMTTLRDRRNHTIGPYSPLFYDEPIEFVSASGVWMTDQQGERYLDVYNNVPHVGHTEPRVVAAIAKQAATLNVHTRYLNDRVVEYAERLLATMDPELDRIMFTNSGSESNDLALRVAAQHTGAEGVLISDFSYHGHTRALVDLTTGLRTHEGLAPHVRTIRIPDLDGDDRNRDAADVLTESLSEADRMLDELQEAGHGVSAVLIESLFSTEGLNRVPDGYVAGLVARVRARGGLVIGDEVQSGFGRTGTSYWGYSAHGFVPDLVTMGKPMGNGHPLGGRPLRAALLDEFGPRNMYFNTFGGNPVSSAAGLAVLDVLRDDDLIERARATGDLIRARLEEITRAAGFAGAVKGSGLFFGFDVYDRAAADPAAAPDPARTKRLVEGMRRRRILISRIGRNDNVLKMRPPMVFGPDEAGLLLDALTDTIREEGEAR
jgi:4-aminobutyrate aminotransferase-like enzyme/Ser/Thr protein kinase RdoA (MazF antagonist)